MLCYTHAIIRKENDSMSDDVKKYRVRLVKDYD